MLTLISVLIRAVPSICGSERELSVLTLKFRLIGSDLYMICADLSVLTRFCWNKSSFHSRRANRK